MLPLFFNERLYSFQFVTLYRLPLEVGLRGDFFSLGINKSPPLSFSLYTYSLSLLTTYCYLFVQQSRYTLEVKNTLGQVVYSENLTNYTGKYSHDVDLEKYSSGMYFISLTNSREQSMKRIVNQ